MAAEESYSLHFRIPIGLKERIDADAAHLGITRASYCRALLQQAMGDDTHRVVLHEAFYRLGPVLKSATARVINVAYESLPAILEEELAAQSGE
jgi:predicted DNA-binding protein